MFGGQKVLGVDWLVIFHALDDIKGCFQGGNRSDWISQPELAETPNFVVQVDVRTELV